MRKYLKVVGATAASLALVSAFALGGCQQQQKQEAAPADNAAATADAAATTPAAGQLQVFAANSLEKALPEVQALYTTATGTTFADTQFKASGDLVEQLSAGATADVLITASTGTMDKAIENGSVTKDSETTMFVNDLVVCTASGSNITISSLDDLKSDAVTSIAIGEPNTVPAGKYALQSLESAGLATYDTAEDGTISNIVWDPSIANKMNAGADKVGTVASYVKEGQCDVGFVYSSDIFRYDGIQTAYTVPADMHKAIKYPGAPVASSANADAAKAFITFCMTDPDAQKVFSKYGFELAS
jgi:molybdate transport system substrate-binding protein